MPTARLATTCAFDLDTELTLLAEGEVTYGMQEPRRQLGTHRGELPVVADGASEPGVV
jgi:hypothetical protein